VAVEIVVTGSYNDKDIKRAMRDLNKMSDEAGGTSKSISEKFSALAGSMENVGRKMTAAVTLPIAAAGAAAFAAFAEEEAAIAKMQSVIKSTGGVAGVTSDHVLNLASSLQKTTTFADDATINAAALALTFKNLRNEAGAGNDVFDRTIKASQDMATVMGTDLNSATMMISKALNEPAEGLGKLSRAGVQFTAEQENMIKTLAASGDTLGAQKIILGELESQFGGAAEAMAKTSSGQLKQAFNNLGDAAEQFGAVVAPAIEKVAGWLTKLAQKFQSLSPAQKQFVVGALAIAAAIGPVLLIGAKLITAFQALMPVFKAVKAAILIVKGAMLGLNAVMMANPVVLIVVAVVALIAILVVAYKKFEGFRNVVDTVFRAIANVAKWLWSNVLKPVFTWIAGIFTDYVIPAAMVMRAAVIAIFSAIGKAASWLWDKIGPVLMVIGQIIKTVVVGYLKMLWTVWSTVFRAIGVVAKWLWDTVLKPVFGFIGNVIMNVVVPYVKFLFAVWSKIFEAIGAVVGWVWNNVLKPIFNFISQIITGIIIPIFITLGAIIGLIWKGISAAISFVWESVLKPIFNFIGQIISGIIIPIFVTLGAIFGLIWQGIAAAVTWVWENVLRPIWNAISAFISAVLMPVLQVLLNQFRNVWNGISAGVQWAWGILSSVFNSIKNGFQSVASFFGDKVSQIVGVFSGIAETIGGAFRNAFQRIKDWWNRTIGGKGFKAPDWLGGAEFRIPTFAKGGVVPGIPGTPVPAILHAGEMVLRRQQVDNFATAPAASSSAQYAITVNVAPGANPVDTGRAIVDAIKAYERSNSASWRGAA
jgi:phage-related protein